MILDTEKEIFDLVSLSPATKTDAVSSKSRILR